MPYTFANLVHLVFLLLLRNLGNVFNFSWGSLVLSCLYRALDLDTMFDQENIVGCMLLL